MPNKAHKPTDKTRAEVSALASFGIPQDDIGAYIGISHTTVRKYYGDEIKVATIKANANVAKFLYKLASGAAMGDGATYGDCKTAAMFWLKTRAGWRETERIEEETATPIEYKVRD